MSLPTSDVPGAKDYVIDFRPIDRSAIGPLTRSSPASRLADAGITLSLEHLDVAPAVKAQDRELDDSTDGVLCFNVSAKRLARRSEEAARCPAPEISEDPVILRLSDALAAMETAPDRHAAICADALRLAILTRQFSGQTDAGRTAPAGGTVEDRAARNVRSLQKWRLNRVLQYVDDHLAARLTLQDLAKVAGLSRMHFAAQFRAAVGMRPHQYLLKRRVERAEELLRQAELSLVDVALTVGFQTQAHFTTVFKRFAGNTPHQWRSAYLAQSTPLPPAPESLS